MNSAIFVAILTGLYFIVTVMLETISYSYYSGYLGFYNIDKNYFNYKNDNVSVYVLATLLLLGIIFIIFLIPVSRIVKMLILRTYSAILLIINIGFVTYSYH